MHKFIIRQSVIQTHMHSRNSSVTPSSVLLLPRLPPPPPSPSSPKEGLCTLSERRRRARPLRRRSQDPRATTPCPCRKVTRMRPAFCPLPELSCRPGGAPLPLGCLRLPVCPAPSLSPIFTVPAPHLPWIHVPSSGFSSFASRPDRPMSVGKSGSDLRRDVRVLLWRASAHGCSVALIQSQHCRPLFHERPAVRRDGMKEAGLCIKGLLLVVAHALHLSLSRLPVEVESGFNVQSGFIVRDGRASVVVHPSCLVQVGLGVACLLLLLRLLLLVVGLCLLQPFPAVHARVWMRIQVCAPHYVGNKNIVGGLCRAKETETVCVCVRARARARARHRG